MTTIDAKIIIREGDVYGFRFNEEETKKRFEPYHCFDGQLTVKKDYSGKLRFFDSYWNFSGDCTKTFTLQEALKYGTLTFKCNMEDVEEMYRGEENCLSDQDIIDLSNQHGCHKRLVKRKGAQPCKEKMKAVLLEKIASKRSEIESAQSTIEWLKKDLAKVVAGDLSNVYI